MLWEVLLALFFITLFKRPQSIYIYECAIVVLYFNLCRRSSVVSTKQYTSEGGGGGDTVYTH